MTPSRVLVVDDDWFARQVYADCLRLDGHDVTTAGDGEEALILLSQSTFDLLVTDVMMPGIDGLELLDRARQLDASLDVVVMTSLQTVETAIRALRAGARHYLVKPVDPEALQIEARRVIATRRLVAENAELRRSFNLFQSAQRLSACVDRDKLHPMAIDVLMSAVGADAGVFLHLDRDAIRAGVCARRALDEVEAESLAQAVVELGAASLGRGIVTLEASVGPGPALVVPIKVGDATSDAVGLVRRGESSAFTGEQVRDAAFLSDYVSMAISNTARLDAAQSLAFVDSLTGLHNARFLEAVLDREIERRKGDARPFSVLFVDLDLFKRVNDTHGHQVGGKVLAEAARVLRRCVREEDVLTRYGGDEFVSVMLDARLEAARACGERIRRAVETHRFLAREGLDLSLTVSVGVASWPLHARTKEDVLHRADLAMFQAKSRDRNTVYTFDELPLVSLARSG